MCCGGFGVLVWYKLDNLGWAEGLGCGEVEIEKTHIFQEKSQGSLETAIWGFREGCGLHVPGRTLAAGMRHLLRGCLGVGMVQT